MRISRIAQQIKNTERASVFVDGKYAFSLNLKQLLESKLKSGTDIDEAQLKAFIKMSQDGKLKMRATEWLLIRPRSAKELNDYLYRKKLEPEQIKEWLVEFQKKNYQNDKYFARWWVEQRRNKNRSSMYIKSELKTKGVDDEIINSALEDNILDDKQALKALIEKKQKLAKYQDKKKLIEYLLRLGYRYSLIKEVLAE
jgi:regulatory protein